MQRQREDSMAPSQAQPKKQINWNEYNYPPLLKLMHFRPSELPEDRKTLVMLLFVLHITCLGNCQLNIVVNCIQGGINILYSFLFFFMFNPIVLFLFYRAYIGICKDKSKLGLYTWIQPPVILVQIVLAIVDFLGFNGFIRVADLFQKDHVVSGILAIVVSIVFLGMAAVSIYVYIKIFKQKSMLTAALL